MRKKETETAKRWAASSSLLPAERSTVDSSACPREREIFIDNLLVRVHLIIEMILVDRPCASGV